VGTLNLTARIDLQLPNEDVAPHVIDRLNAALEGRYRIERELGEGGMATVYLAEDVRHKRHVALKVLKPELAAIVGAERFLAEIETTASLQHPNILPLFDSGEADGFLFYVMPYVEGESLRERLDREKQLPVDEAVRITVEVAEALQSAHDRDVVHRDIKPANIMLSQGRPLVADFGIALALSSAGSHRLTETGLSIGTPQYMSPEQATGDRVVGPAADLYSLGCMLYEMLVGDPPYTGSTAQAILAKVITGDTVPVTEQRRAVPPHVDAVVRRALEKLPADRFRSAAALAQALRDERFRHGVSDAGARMGSRRAPWLAVGGWVLAAALTTVVVRDSLSTDAPRPVRELSLAVPIESGPSELALDADASVLVLSDRPQDAGAGRSLYALGLYDRTRTAIPGSEGAIDWAVSPDGSRVAFMNGSGLHVAPLGRPPRSLDERATCCVHWSGDEVVYYTAGTRIRRATVDGAQPESVLESDEGAGFFHYTPVGDGGRAIVVSFDFSSPTATAQIEWIDASTGQRQVITEGDRPFLTSEGYLVFDRDESLWAARLDPESLELLEGPVRMVERIVTTVSDALFSLSESGDLVYWLPSEEGVEGERLVRVDRAGNATPLDPDWVVAAIESVEVSPDGSRAAVAVGSMLQSEIWIHSLRGGTSGRLTSYGGMNRRPVWAPDGESVAFISDRGGRRSAYTVPVAGVVTPELLLEVPDQDVDEVLWSPDGNWLVYRTGTGVGATDIFARRMGPDTMTIAVSNEPGIDERAPVLSPDGRWVAYVSDEGGQPAIWVRPFPEVDAGRRRVSSGFGVEPVWSDDGEELFYRDDANLMSVAISDPETFVTGEERVLFPNSGFFAYEAYRAYDFDPASDGLLMIASWSRWRNDWGVEPRTRLPASGWREHLLHPGCPRPTAPSLFGVLK
jgi:serine/threonine-protein kinase